MKKIILFILFLLPGISFSQSSWQWVNPKPDGYSVFDIKYVNEFTGYQLCPPGIIRKTTDSGTSWQIAYFGKNTDNLTAISLAGSNTIFASSFPGFILKSSNAGLNWSRINLDTNIWGSYDALYDILFVNENTGYIGGLSNLFKTTNSGSNWISVIGGDSVYMFDHIRFVNQNTGYTNSYFKRRIYKTTNGGLSWNYNIWPPSIYQINDLHFINSETGYISTSHGMWKTTNSGQAFLQVNLEPYPNDSSVGWLYFKDQLTGFTTAGVNLFRTTNSGITWTPFNRVINEFEYVGGRFHFNSSGSGWAYGLREYRTTNLGETWTPITKGFTHGIIRADFLDTSNIFIFAQSWNVYHEYYKFWIKSTDGGYNWQEYIFSNNPLGENIRVLKFLNELTGFYIGDTTLYKSINGGNNWDINFHNFYGMLGIDFVNLNTGFIMDYNDKLFRTIDGGNSWYNIYTFSKNFFAPSKFKFLNSNTGFVAEYYGVYKTTNSGLNWERTFLNPTGFGYDSYFQSENKIYLIGATDLYRTNNGGLNWEVFSLPIVNSFTIFEVINDVIYTWGRVPNSQDNEFFKSTNGGETWVSFNIGVIPYDVSEIKFLNENTGYITTGNAILRTTNGGTTFINNISSSIPEEFILHQNYPNPFNPSTKIKFEIPKPGRVELTVYDITGRKITGLLNENLNAGSYEVIFNANNLSSGVYFYTLKSKDFIESKKMLYIK